MTSLLSAYKGLVQDNAAVVKKFEDTARMLTMFLPGRFGAGQDVFLEGSNALINLLSLYNESILAAAAAATGGAPSARYVANGHARLRMCCVRRVVWS